MCANKINLVFAGIIFAILISPVAYAEIKFCSAEYNPVNAYNPATGDCKTFSNSCNVADGWIKIDDCANAPKPEGYINKTLTFTGAGEQSFEIVLKKDLHVSSFYLNVNGSAINYVDYKIAESLKPPLLSRPWIEDGRDWVEPYGAENYPEMKIMCDGTGYNVYCGMKDFSVNIDADVSRATAAKIIFNGKSLVTYAPALLVYFINKDCSIQKDNYWKCFMPQWGYEEFPYVGTTKELNIRLGALATGQNIFSFSDSQKDPNSYLNSAVLRIYTGDSYPSDLKIDFGGDGIYEALAENEIKGSKEIFIPSDEVNSALENCAPDANGFCKIPVKVKSESTGILEVQKYSFDVAKEQEVKITPLNINLDFTNSELDFSENNVNAVSLKLPKSSNFSSFKFKINASSVDYVEQEISSNTSLPERYTLDGKCSEEPFRRLDDYVYPSCETVDFEVNVDMDLKKVDSAKLVAKATTTSSGDSPEKLYYFLNNNCQISPASTCFEWGSTYWHDAPGGCLILDRYGSVDISKCQWPTTSGSIVESKGCGGGWPYTTCIWYGRDCSYMQNFNIYDCAPSESGQMNFYKGTSSGAVPLYKLIQGTNTFSFAEASNYGSDFSLVLDRTKLRLYTKDIYPTSIMVDFGSDDSVDYIYLGEMRGEKFVEIPAEVVNKFLESCEADADGMCEVPVSFYADSGAKFDLISLLIEEPVIEQGGEIEIFTNQSSIYPFALASGISQENSGSSEENNSSAENILLPLALLSGAGAVGYSYLSRRNLGAQNKNNYLNAGAGVAENETAKQNIFKQSTGNGSVRKNIDNYLLAHKTGARYASGLLKASGATAAALGMYATAMGAWPAGLALAAGGGAAYVAGGAVGMGLNRAVKTDYSAPKENIFGQIFREKDSGEKIQSFIVSNTDTLKKTSDGLGWASIGMLAAKESAEQIANKLTREGVAFNIKNVGGFIPEIEFPKIFSSKNISHTLKDLELASKNIYKKAEKILKDFQELKNFKFKIGLSELLKPNKAGNLAASTSRAFTVLDEKRKAIEIVLNKFTNTQYRSAVTLYHEFIHNSLRVSDRLWKAVGLGKLSVEERKIILTRPLKTAMETLRNNKVIKRVVKGSEHIVDLVGLKTTGNHYLKHLISKGVFPKGTSLRDAIDKTEGVVRKVVNKASGEKYISDLEKMANYIKETANVEKAALKGLPEILGKKGQLAFPKLSSLFPESFAKSAGEIGAKILKSPAIKYLGKFGKMGSKAFGKIALPIGIGVSAGLMGLAIKKDGGKFGKNAAETVGEEAGGWIGFFGGAVAAAPIAAAVAVVPVVGWIAAPLIVLGAGVAGMMAGSAVGKQISSYIYDKKDSIKSSFSNFASSVKESYSQMSSAVKNSKIYKLGTAASSGASQIITSKINAVKIEAKNLGSVAKAKYVSVKTQVKKSSSSAFDKLKKFVSGKKVQSATPINYRRDRSDPSNTIKKSSGGRSSGSGKSSSSSSGSRSSPKSFGSSVNSRASGAANKVKSAASSAAKAAKSTVNKAVSAVKKGLSKLFGK